MAATDQNRVDEIKRRLAALSTLVNGASAQGVALPDAVDAECRTLRAELARLEPGPVGSSK
jgi:hypothetical protein